MDERPWQRHAPTVRADLPDLHRLRSGIHECLHDRIAIAGSASAATAVAGLSRAHHPYRRLSGRANDRHTLASLARERYPGQLEIIVLNDGSTDGTADAAVNAAEGLHFYDNAKVRVIDYVEKCWQGGGA